MELNKINRDGDLVLDLDDSFNNRHIITITGENLEALVNGEDL